MNFKPTWYTIPEFANRVPMDMYHKESVNKKIAVELVKNLHVLTRTSYVVDDESSQYTLGITADDSYKLYINGEYVTQGPIFSYVEHYFYHEVDITPYLKKGKNVIALHTYYQGVINRVQNSGDGRYAVATMIRKAEENWVDLQWKYQVSAAYTGGVIGYNTQFMEDFDSNIWEENWNEESYDDSLWDEMVPATWADYTLEKQPVKAITRYEVPIKTIEKSDKKWWIDLGQEITGNIQLEATGVKGQIVSVRCGEELNDDGSVRYKMRCFCQYEELWTLASGKVCKLEQYDYKGFRYIELLPDEGIEILSLKVFARHYPMDDETCTLNSSNEMLDQVFRICKNGVKYGTQEGFVDCPTREKGQYVGDAIVTGNAQSWLTGTTEMMEKCIRLIAQTKDICPGLLAVVPGNQMQEIADFSLMWAQTIMQYYRFTGKTKLLKEMRPVVIGMIEYFRQFAREDGLLSKVDDKWNLVDWPEGLRDNYDFPLTRPIMSTECHNVINALYIGAMQTLAEIEALIGAEQTYDWECVGEAYIKAFYRPEQGLFADREFGEHCAMHSNLYALYFGLVPKEREQKTGDFLIRKGLNCGVYTTYFLLKALARIGRYQDVYDLMINETEHGWVNMVREGATCCYEAWGKDQKWNTSLCHPWASAPITILIEYIGGFVLDPSSEKGYYFEPHIPEELEEFELNLMFRGEKYKIKKQDQEVELKIGG